MDFFSTNSKVFKSGLKVHNHEINSSQLDLQEKCTTQSLQLSSNVAS